MKKAEDLLPYERTDEDNALIMAKDLKRQLAPKWPPPKQYIASGTVKRFDETRAKLADLASEYERSLFWSKGKTIAQLGEQINQSLPPLIVHSYDDPRMAEIVSRCAVNLGMTVQYQCYFPMADLAYKYTYGKLLVKHDQLPHLRMGASCS
jgi:hypothetical protein